MAYSWGNQPEVDLSCRFLLEIFFRFCKEQREFTKPNHLFTTHGKNKAG